MRSGVFLLRKSEKSGESRRERKKQAEAEVTNNTSLGLHAAEEEVARTFFTINITKLF